MKTHRENPEGAENPEAAKQNERDFFVTVAQKLHALQGTMKTIEQQAIEHAEALHDIADILDLPTGATPAEIVEAVRREASESLHRWIPVTERLPEGQEVIYWDGEEVSTFFPVTGEDDGNQAAARCESFGITHWMPMPKAPSADPSAE